MPVEEAGFKIAPSSGAWAWIPFRFEDLIFRWFVNSQQFIRFKDVSWEMIQKGYQATYKIFKKGVRYKKIEKYKLPQLMDRISGDISLNGFESMDLVIEAVPEDMELKKRKYVQ